MKRKTNLTTGLRQIPFLLALALAGCDSPSEPRRPEPSTVQVSAPDSVLRVGRTLQLAAEVRDARGRPISGEPVTWTSSDTTLARVSASGEVTGVRQGAVTITVARGEASGTVALRVFTSIQSLGLRHEGLVVPIGGTRQFRAVLTDSAGMTLAGIPVRFWVAEPRFATVSDSGVVQAIATGNTTLWAEAEGVRSSVPLYLVPPVDVVPLGTLGGAASRAFGLNARGDVVGEAQTASGAWHAFLWRGGAMTDLGALGGRGRAVAVNGTGTVVGVFYPGADTTGGARPFLWRDGATTVLPVPEAEDVYATDVNDRGQVVGYSATRCPLCPFGTVGSALLWEGGELRDLGRLGGHQAIATAITEQGSIVGGVQPQDSAVLLVGDEVRRIFPGIARAVSGVGHVAGDSRQDAFFIWRDGVTQSIPIFYRDRLRVFGVDTRGRMLALLSYGFPSLSSPPKFVIRQPDNLLFGLYEMLAPGTPWRVEGVSAMNDRGEIVGWGKNSTTGEVQALLLKPRG